MNRGEAAFLLSQRSSVPRTAEALRGQVHVSQHNSLSRMGCTVTSHHLRLETLLMDEGHVNMAPASRYLCPRSLFSQSDLPRLPQPFYSTKASVNLPSQGTDAFPSLISQALTQNLPIVPGWLGWRSLELLILW